MAAQTTETVRSGGSRRTIVLVVAGVVYASLLYLLAVVAYNLGAIIGMGETPF